MLDFKNADSGQQLLFAILIRPLSCERGNSVAVTLLQRCE